MTVCCAYPSLISLMVSVDVKHHERIEKSLRDSIKFFSPVPPARERYGLYYNIYVANITHGRFADLGDTVHSES